MKSKSVEILAPAGSYESMMAAVAAGADAVYIGGSRFGARAYADNPEEDRLLDAIDYIHLHGCKIYMTVNTLVKEQELGDLYEYLKPYYSQGIDAVIVQDLGVFSYIRQHFPDLPVHASTQMTITGVYGAKLLQLMGAERIVTARELSLDEIKAIHKETEIEIESFIHGALCYCYSGQCLFSSMIGGRSGNRGRCAQTCRLPFDVMKDGQRISKKDEKYVLSLKDLNSLDLIPDIIESGVYSLKIEGRMKSPRYTAGVVSIYRKYVDRYLQNGRKGYFVDQEDHKNLQDLFDRGGQTQGYYKQHNDKNMVVWKEKPSFRQGNQLLFDQIDKTYLEIKQQKPVDGFLYVAADVPMQFSLWYKSGEETIMVSVEGDIPQKAQNQPLAIEKLEKQIKKTGSTPFYFEELQIELSDNLFVPVQSLNELRRKGLEALEGKIYETFRRSVPEPKLNLKSESGKKVKSHMISGFYVVLEDPETFHEALAHESVIRIYLDSAEFSPVKWQYYVQECHNRGKECFLAMPHVFRTKAERFFSKYKNLLEEAEFDGVLIRSLEEIGFLSELNFKGTYVFDYNLYVMNHGSYEVLYQLGADEVTFPVELNEKELRKLPINGEFIVYGKIPMMVSAQCIHQGVEGCDKKTTDLILKDKIGKEFPVKNHCRFCYNTIYNALPLSLIGQEEIINQLEVSGLRLQFTNESPGQVKQVLTAFSDAFMKGSRAGQPVDEFTRGHFKRGIE